MYAVISTGGKQYRLSEGDVVRVERLSGEIGDQVVFDEVQLIGGDEEAVVGKPVVAGARVVGTILDHGKGDKVTVFRFKRRKMYRKKQGHRQLLTSVRVDSIETKGSSEKKSVEKKGSAKEVLDATPEQVAAAKQGKPKAKKSPAGESKTSEKKEE